MFDVITDISLVQKFRPEAN